MFSVLNNVYYESKLWIHYMSNIFWFKLCYTWVKRTVYDVASYKQLLLL